MTLGSAPGHTRVWQGIEAEDPPCLRHDFPELLAMAERMLASREKRFPAMIAAGQIAPDVAARQLELFRQIAADWRWICTGEGDIAPVATIAARREALDDSLRTIAAVARERGGFDAELEQQAHLVIAMRWHLEPERLTHVNARLTHALRAKARGHSPKEVVHA